MVECVVEILRLMILSGIMVLLAKRVSQFLTKLIITILRTLTTVSTVRTTVTTVTVTLSALRTLTTVATLWTLTALTTGGTLHVIGGLLNQHTVAQLVLTRLRVNLQKLHLNVVAFLDAGLFNRLQADARG